MPTGVLVAETMYTAGSEGFWRTPLVVAMLCGGVVEVEEKYTRRGGYPGEWNRYSRKPIDRFVE